jgi:competence protein ComEC
MKWIESYAKKEVFYMAKRRSKKKQQKMIRSFITLAIVIILGLFSMIVQPWKYIDSDKDPIGGKSEINENDLQVHYIDVGQADCILIRVPTKDGLKNMLIDAGTSDGYKQQVILDYLDGQGVETLEYMIVTHPHADHNAAALKVLKTYSVKNLILPECETSQKTWLNMLEWLDEQKKEYIPSEVGDTYQIGDASFEILGPVDTSKVKDPNDYSVVIRMDYGETSFLFTGDAEEASEKAMLAANDASKFKCDVLKLGHHGSESSTSDAFLKAADPSLGIIMSGGGNEYGHPDKVVVDRLTAAGVEILRTDLEGTIVICSDKKEVYRYNSK